MRWGAAFFYSFFLTERNSCERHTEDEVNKSSDAQRHSTANIQMHFPHHECRRHSNPPRLSPPRQRAGELGSLHATFPRPNAAHDVQFTPIKGV